MEEVESGSKRPRQEDEEEDEEWADDEDEPESKRQKIEEEGPILFQIIDYVELYTDRGVPEERICVIGKDEDGQVVQVEVEKVPNEIFISVGEDFTDVMADQAIYSLEKYLWRQPHRCKRPGCECKNNGQATTTLVQEGETVMEPCIKRRKFIRKMITHYEIVERRGYNCHEKYTRPFLRIVYSHAFYAIPIQDWAKKQSFGNGSAEHAGSYNVTPRPVDSFNVRKNVASFTWFQIPSENKRLTENGQRYLVHYDDIVPAVNPPKSPVKFLLMYIDIETVSKRYANAASKRAEYPIGVVCTTLSTGEKQTFMLAAGDNPDVAGATVFDTEENLLSALHGYIVGMDPDVFVGYNSNGYDFPYLFRRAKRLGLEQFPWMSRMPEYQATFTEKEMRSNQAGTVSLTTWSCPGRVFLDLFQIARKGLRLDSYSLSSVAEAYGMDGKDNLPYDQIYDHFHGTKEQREKLAKYCMRDVEMCVTLQDVKMCALLGLMAQCDVQRLRAKDALERGLGYQLSMLVRLDLAENGYVNRPMITEYDAKQKKRLYKLDPSFKMVEGYETLFDMKMMNEKYPGAFVVKPDVGLHKDYVVTLDFASLYPSLIRTFNICRSTQLKNKNEMPPEDCHVSPVNFAFVKHHIKEGVLPRIERKLVEARKKEKDAFAAETDPDRKQYHDMMQLKLKISANSLYGLLGAMASEISQFSAAYSITAWGSKYIREVKRRVEEHFPVKVIYGDTDSVFIRLNGIQGVENLEVARKLGAEICAWVNDFIKSEFPEGNNVLKMEFENLSFLTMLLKKKKYTKLVYPAKRPKDWTDGWDPSTPEVPKLKKSGILTRAQTKYTTEVINTILDMAMLQGKSQDELNEYIEGKVADLYLGMVPDKKVLMHSCKLSKPLKEYKSETIHTVAAKQMILAGMDVEPGDRIEYYHAELNAPAQPKKKDFVIAAHLVNDFALKWKDYVDELRKAMEKMVFPLLNCSAEYLTRWDRYVHAKVRAKKAPATAIEDPESGEGSASSSLVAMGFVKRTPSDRKTVKQEFLARLAAGGHVDRTLEEEAGVESVKKQRLFGSSLPPPDKAKKVVVQKKDRVKAMKTENTAITSFFHKAKMFQDAPRASSPTSAASARPATIAVSLGPSYVVATAAAEEEDDYDEEEMEEMRQAGL